MWYVTWILGLGFAVLLGVASALYGEYHDDQLEEKESQGE